MEQLQQWLDGKCKEQNLSWREASMKADLNPGAISAIMGGQVPGLESCKALAKFFRVSPVLILRLAGHIEENAPNLNLRHDPIFARWQECFLAMTPEARSGYVLDVLERVAGLPPTRPFVPKLSEQ